MSPYVQLLRRRREGATDYRARRRAIISQRTLLVVRVSGSNVSAQFVKPLVGGDSVLASAHSRQLRKLGWMGSLKSTPACYLLGMLAGKKALEKGVKDAVLYNGVAPFVRGSRIAAFVNGVVDAGVEVPADKAVFPSKERITGKVIADYAAAMAKEDRGAYEKRFSALLKAGFKPEEYPAGFEKVKAAIAGGSKK